jgi:hypothetical protein
MKTKIERSIGEVVMRYFIHLACLIVTCCVAIVCLSCDYNFPITITNKTADTLNVMLDVTLSGTNEKTDLGNLAPDKSVKKVLGYGGGPNSITVSARRGDGTLVFDRTFTRKDYTYAGFQVTITTPQ